MKSYYPYNGFWGAKDHAPQSGEYKNFPTQHRKRLRRKLKKKARRKVTLVIKEQTDG